MKISSLLLLILLFEGCDVAHSITLKTAKKPNISITVYGNRPLRWTSVNGDRTKIIEEKIIQVPDTMGNRRVDLPMGWGGWTKRMIAGFSTHIDSIIINNSKSTTKLKDSTAISAYLLKRRRWLLTNVITIKAK
jgi:hypothetical protein